LFKYAELIFYAVFVYGQEDQLNYVEFYAGQAEVHKAVSMVYPRSAATDIAYGTHLKGEHNTNPHDVLTSSGLASTPQMLKSKSNSRSAVYFQQHANQIGQLLCHKLSWKWNDILISVCIMHMQPNQTCFVLIMFIFNPKTLAAEVGHLDAPQFFPWPMPGIICNMLFDMGIH